MSDGLTPEETRLLAHACGLTNQLRRRTPDIYRNHYVCPEHDPAVAGLVAREYLEVCRRQGRCGGNVVYHATKKGQAAALLWWHEQRTARGSAKRTAKRTAKRADDTETLKVTS